MASITDREFDEAEARGRAIIEKEPRASAARYDGTSGRVTIELANGCSYAFPVALVQDLQGAADTDLAVIAVEGLGLNLHWPRLDVDLYVPALVAGIFGTRAWLARELAGIAGRKTSPAKAAAARSNGLKGGRPRKTARG